MSSRSLCLLGAIVLTASLAAPVRATRCELLPEQARAQYLALREAMNKANDAARDGAYAIQKFGPEFQAAVEAYNASNQAIKDHRAKEPGKDINRPLWFDGRTPENQAQLKEWEAAKIRLEVVRENKLKTLQSAMDKLGNMYCCYQVPKETLRDTKEVLAALGATGAVASVEFERLMLSVTNPPPGTDDYATSRFHSADGNTGLLEAAEKSMKDAKKAREEVIKFANKCPYGVVINDESATAGRTDDATSVDRNRNNTNGNGNANRANANNANNSNRAAEFDDFGNLVEERNSNNSNAASASNGNNANNANAASASNANNANNANAASNSNADKVYTVKAGDNLSAIARKLAPSLGNPPISELVNKLYANMTTKSKSNPSLIFPGDTIDLAGVKKDLAG